MQPLLDLLMMVKDEAKNIADTLASVKPFVDGYLILDTGSTDGTVDIARQTMTSYRGIIPPGDFDGYANTRNRVLDMHQREPHKAAFSIMLSGDEILHGGEALRQYLETQRDSEFGAFCVEMYSGTNRWLYPRVFRTDGQWRYVGDPHEIPQGPNGERTGPTIPGVYIEHLASDPERRLERVRNYDLPRLQVRVANKDADPEELGQAIWFLAQSHEMLAEAEDKTAIGGEYLRHRLMAMTLYHERAKLGDDPIKASFAFFRYLNVANSLSSRLSLFTNEEMMNRLRIVIDMNPFFPEPRYMLAALAAQLDARQGLPLAEEAAKVAAQAREMLENRDQRFYLPTDVRVEWMSYRLAAECAKALGYAGRAERLARSGIQAGGSVQDFEVYLSTSTRS